MSFRLERQSKEVPYQQFVKIVKKLKYVCACLSHSQKEPDNIYSSAVLMWQYDADKDVLFCITCTGKRAECNEGMPAFHIYDIEPD